MDKYITSVPREFVLSSSNNRTPLYIYGGTGVGCHLEVGHITQWSYKKGKTKREYFCSYQYIVDEISSFITWNRNILDFLLFLIYCYREIGNRIKLMHLMHVTHHMLSLERVSSG